MNSPQLYLPEPLKVAYGKVGQYRRFQQPKKKNGTVKRKGIERIISNRKNRFVTMLFTGSFFFLQATIQLDVVEAETEEITQGNTLLRARRTTKRLSVTSLPSGLQKVHDLAEAVTDKSMKLLAQRHAELQRCEFLGDEILQSSKQFQRISKRTMRKYKLKNVCFPCTCCCF
ncbi:putative uncharacterized protein C3orf49 [Sciurus carolinensis]|uniref:Uncharacterized protein n=1 Tax=Sciurus carolinensis TaxID=30640 RepID=A0AA41MFS3_SCICA|nr:putative uncharacterized protein C3orf49 [Sciurus carolinensis]